MFPPFVPKSKSRLQIEMDRLVLELSDHDPTTEKYGQIVDRLSKLEKIEQEKKPSRISPDVLATISAHLLGIVMIIKYEELNVITTKALNFLPRLR